LSGPSVSNVQVGNDLDNARLSFDHVKLPRSALLSKHAEVTPQGTYNLKTKGVPPFLMIGQRLYTGRVCVAQAALEYRKTLFQRVKAYTDKKLTHGRGGVHPPLSEIPQLRALFKENDARCHEIEEFVATCEAALSVCLRKGELPSEQLVDAIATAKIVAVEDSIAACHSLKQECGSYALMADSGFKHLDFLQCCKFAEGDSRILMQKLARDRFKRFQVKQGGLSGGEAISVPGDAVDPEEKACAELARGLASRRGQCSQAEAWNAEWEGVYTLARVVMERIQSEGIQK
jgi:hypothetical protein